MTTFEISIHALREEGDAPSGRNTPDTPNFYPRPPRGGRLEGAVHGIKTKDFYPRPPRGGRRVSGLVGASPTYFYPRPPRGGRRFRDLRDYAVRNISIHALREEGDLSFCAFGNPVSGFLSTPSARRATTQRLQSVRIGEFLSTPSARRATAKTETKSLFSNKLYNILHEFRRALIYNGSKNYPNHAK